MFDNQLFQPMNIGPNEPPMPPMTVFLDGLIGMREHLSLICGWCDAQAQLSEPSDNMLHDWRQLGMPDGWRTISHDIESDDGPRVMCPACVKTEIPEE
jgi:hypothetical protein